MAVLAEASTHAKFMLASKEIDLENDELRVILLNSTFTFDKNVHGILSNVSAYELESNFGYVSNGIQVTNVGLVENLVDSKASIICSDAMWNAVGGSIGPIGSYVIVNNTVADKTIMGCVSFQGITYTIPDGLSFLVRSTVISLI